MHRSRVKFANVVFKVKSERDVLSAVAGHPFITTMVASFSDSDCLYMIVRIWLVRLCQVHADGTSP